MTIPPFIQLKLKKGVLLWPVKWEAIFPQLHRSNYAEGTFVTTSLLQNITKIYDLLEE